MKETPGGQGHSPRLLPPSVLHEGEEFPRRQKTCAHAQKGGGQPQGPAGWECFLRDVLPPVTPAGRLLRLLHGQHLEGLAGAGLSETPSSAPLLPMRLPFADVEGRLLSGAVMRKSDLAKAWANRVIALFNHYALGGKAFKWAVASAGEKANHEQMKFALSLIVEVSGFVAAPPDLEAGRGRASEDLDAALDALGRVGYGCGDMAVEALATTALDVDLDRIAVPASAGQCKPADVIRGSRKEEFLETEARRLPREAWGAPVRGCHRVPEDSEAALHAKLVGCSMGCWIEEEELCRSF